MAKRKIIIDSSKGGNGDIWMRLAGFYAMAALLPEIEILLLIPRFLRPLAVHAFGDRLGIVDGDGIQPSITYTNLGVKHLFGNILKGRRYVSPFQRSVIRDKQKRRLKDYANVLLFTLLDAAGFVQVPAWKWIESYQGYLDVVGMKTFRKVGYEIFLQQLKKDSAGIYKKLNSHVPVSPELSIPVDLSQSLIVFPTGTSRQFIPTWWAKKYLPEAYYAFFHKDSEAEAFRQQGLKVIYFYHEPGDIIVLSQNAAWTISTDSFPSHLLQYSSKRTTITITEVLRSRIIAPVYKGEVVNAVAPCHPCLHLDRKNHPLCAAGFGECVNWKSEVYSKNVLDSISTKAESSIQLSGYSKNIF